MNRVNQLISDAENFSAGRINHFHHPPHHQHLIAWCLRHFWRWWLCISLTWWTVVMLGVALAMTLFNDMVQFSSYSTPMALLLQLDPMHCIIAMQWCRLASGQVLQRELFHNKELGKCFDICMIIVAVLSCILSRSFSSILSSILSRSFSQSELRVCSECVGAWKPVYIYCHIF